MPADAATACFTVVATLRAAKGKADALIAMLTEQVGVVRRNEPGCTAYRLHRSTKDPDLFFFYETYVDDAAFELIATRRISPIIGHGANAKVCSTVRSRCRSTAA